MHRGQPGLHPSQLDQRVGQRPVVKAVDVEREEVVDRGVHWLDLWRGDDSEHTFDRSRTDQLPQGGANRC